MKYRLASILASAVPWICGFLMLASILLGGRSVAKLGLMLGLLFYSIINNHSLIQFFLRLMGEDTSDAFVGSAIADSIREENEQFQIVKEDAPSQNDPSQRHVTLKVMLDDSEAVLPKMVQLIREMGKALTRYGWELGEMDVVIDTTYELLDDVKELTASALKDTGRIDEIKRLAERSSIQYCINGKIVDQFNWSLATDPQERHSEI